MELIVIPDCHLKPAMFRQASDLMEKHGIPRAVCLMDIADDWDKGTDLGLYCDTYDAAISFSREHPDTLWCYGNHDVSYLWDAMESGYSVMARETVIEGITKLERVVEDRYNFVHRIDNVLFSHAGLTETFVLHSCGYHVKEIEDILPRMTCSGTATNTVSLVQNKYTAPCGRYRIY